jgi:hypothetical protein
VSLPAGLIVSNILGIFYRTDTGVILAPGASATVPIRAQDPGSSSNLPAGTINHVDGELGLMLRAINTTPASGGSEMQRGVVTQADLEGLQTKLSEDLQRQAMVGLTAAAGPNRMLAIASMQIAIDPASIPDTAIGSPADSFGQTLHAVASGYVFSRADLTAAAKYILQSGLQAGEQLADSTLMFQVEPADANGWTLKAEGRAFTAPDSQAVLMALRLQSVREAQTLLREKFGAAGAPAIQLNPAWLPCLPLFPFRMRIEILPASG